MQTGDIKCNYKELVLYANDDRNYNRWKQPSVYDKWGNVTSKLWMVILGYATCTECTLLTNVFWDISRFSDKQGKRSKTWKLIFAKDPQVTQRLECTLFADIFHIDIKPSFLFTSLTSLPHKTHPYTCVLECCFESFSQETIASSPLFSVCSGL